MADLEFTLTGQKLRTTKVSETVQYTNGVYECFFEPMDTFWEDAPEIVAEFVPNQGFPIKVPCVDWQCKIPAEAVRADWFTVGVFSRDGKKIFPTNYCGRFRVLPGTITVL